ncbi:IucA/IucC family protein [Candidatus Pantoea floridensis]|uniref:N2-citryl-N6-acetyl-N6-hydroxylysine synthase n=1 Tax=Candidatus Pantoea floridensis TaxID=1938870 RepID=A0A286DRT8_9GAMM|nr:IucA/IucC family protein [Pantoea floridensis]PIF07437.1 N2-citryl-N6-acetyl-N6-hydroxylysine synthase [Enterobacteriaceae bacterium JKS000233]SOD61351.1 N2-citryl-N6-acetyl-N6-hydroxylysine synthase [Pantoea floridensis]
MNPIPQSSDVDVAAQCFLNALFRETRDWKHVSEALPGHKEHIHLPLSSSHSLSFPLRYFSPTQHHQYQFPALLISHSSPEGEPVNVQTWVSLILEKPAIRTELNRNVIKRFQQRVLASHTNTWQAIRLRHRWSDLRLRPLAFSDAEQALLVGHAFHPAPKSHEPFNDAEALRYLPEFGSRFPLRWLSVECQYIAGESLGLTLRARLLRIAAQNAPGLLHHFSDTHWLVPMHPWQAQHLLSQSWCQQLVTHGAVSDLGEAGSSWFPTSSSRSLYSPASNDMIKFSLSVRLTNSVRTLSVKEVKRGMRLARLAQTARWQALQLQHPTMRVMQEDGWAGLRNEEGAIQEESLMALRVNLLFDMPATQTNVLVSLTQAAPDGGDSLLAAAVRRLSIRLGLSLTQAAQCWLNAYCDHVLLPLFSTEANFGLVLLAHQQNILVEMQEDLPIGLLYRDCQGSGFTDNASDWLADIDEADAENRFSREQVLRYFPYYLLVNSTLAVTAALGAAGFATERHLMDQVRDKLTALRNHVIDTRTLDYVLDSKHWNCKGNFHCYLHDHNENTIVNPAVIYFDFQNPFYRENA